MTPLRRLCTSRSVKLALVGGTVMAAAALTLGFGPVGSTAGLAQTTANPAPDGVQEALEAIVSEGGAPGVIMLVYRDGKPLYRAVAGEMGPNTQLPVASASKWMTAALIMTLVDEGRLDLDAPIQERLPEFTGQAGRITLRQLLSFTAGQGSLRNFFDVRQSPRMTLREAAAEIALRPLEDEPGAVFKYGGPSLQVAGALAEQATGRSWAELFQERIAGPLGLRDTYWASATRIDPAGVRNPNLQGGLVTTAEDYARFLAVIAGNGTVDGHRYLSPEAVETMETAQTLNVPMAFKPPGVRDRAMHYALGNWCEAYEPTGRCSVVSSPGMFGAYPWVDRETGLYGVFFLKDRLPEVVEHIQQARRLVRDAAAATPPPHAR